jgi:hypothetical protein
MTGRRSRAYALAVMLCGPRSAVAPDCQLICDILPKRDPAMALADI